MQNVETICMKCQSILSVKNKKIFEHVVCWTIYSSSLSIKSLRQFYPKVIKKKAKKKKKKTKKNKDFFPSYTWYIVDDQRFIYLLKALSISAFIT